MRLRYARRAEPLQRRRATPTDTPRPTNTDAEPHPEGADRPSPQRRFPRSSNKNDRRRQIEHPVPTCTPRPTRSPEPTAADTQGATQIDLTCRKIAKSNVSAGQTHDRSGPPGARTQNLRIKSRRGINVGECHRVPLSANKCRSADIFATLQGREVLHSVRHYASNGAPSETHCPARLVHCGRYGGARQLGERPAARVPGDAGRGVCPATTWAPGTGVRSGDRAAGRLLRARR